MTPSALSRLSTAELQLSKAGSLSDATCNSLLRSAQLSVANSADEQVTAAGTLVCLSECLSVCCALNPDTDVYHVKQQSCTCRCCAVSGTHPFVYATCCQVCNCPQYL